MDSKYYDLEDDNDLPSPSPSDSALNQEDSNAASTAAAAGGANYGAEDDEEEEEEPDEPTAAAGVAEPDELELPPSSNDIQFPRYLIMSSLGVYETLRHFSSVLRLACFHYEEFVAALSATGENSAILAEAHICLLRALLKSDESSQVMLCYADQNACLSFYQYLLLGHSTWPYLFHMYARALPHGQLSYVTPNYPLASADIRVRVLRDLCDLFVQSNAVREEMLKEDVRLRYEDHCRVCGKVGDLLCCESCPAVYHLYCLDPPITEVPEDDWQCPVCVRTSVKGVTDCRDPQENTAQHYSHRRRALGRDRAGRLYWFSVRRLFVEDPETEDLVYYSDADQLDRLIASLSPTREKRLLKRLNSCRELVAQQMSSLGGSAAGRELGPAYRRYSNAYSSDERALSKQQLAEEEHRKRHLGYKVCLDAFRWVEKTGEIGSERDILAALRDGLARLADEFPAGFMCPAWASLRPDWLRQLLGDAGRQSGGDKYDDSDLTPKRLARLLAQFALCIRWVCFANFWSEGVGLADLVYITPADKERHKRGRKAEKEAAAAGGGGSATSASAWAGGLDGDLEFVPVVPTKNRKPIRHSVYRQGGEEFRLRAGDGWMWLSRARRSNGQTQQQKKKTNGCSLDQLLSSRQALIESYSIQIPALERRLEAMTEELDTLSNTLAVRRDTHKQQQQQLLQAQQQLQQQQLLTNGGRLSKPTGSVPQYDGAGGYGSSDNDDDYGDDPQFEEGDSEYDDNDDNISEFERRYSSSAAAAAAAAAAGRQVQQQQQVVRQTIRFSSGIPAAVSSASAANSVGGGLTVVGSTPGSVVKVPLVLGGPAATNLVVKRLPGSVGVSAGVVGGGGGGMATVVRIAPPSAAALSPAAPAVIRPTPTPMSASAIGRQVVAPTQIRPVAMATRPSPVANNNNYGNHRPGYYDDEDDDEIGEEDYEDFYGKRPRPRMTPMMSAVGRPRGGRGRGRGRGRPRGRGRGSAFGPASPPSPSPSGPGEYNPFEGFSASRRSGVPAPQLIQRHQQHLQPVAMPTSSQRIRQQQLQQQVMMPNQQQFPRNRSTPSGGLFSQFHQQQQQQQHLVTPTTLASSNTINNRRSAVMSVPQGPVRVRATAALINAAIEHRCRELQLAMIRCRKVLSCLAGENGSTREPAYHVNSVSTAVPEYYSCPKPPPSNRQSCGIFNQPRVQLAKLARRAGRWELPGFNYERKLPALCKWPYPSPRPSVCSVWLNNLLSEPTVFSVAFAMRMLHHCLAWDEISSECPGANQETGEYTVPQAAGAGGGGGGESGKEKKQVTRVVRGHQQLDSCGLTYRYLVEKTIVTSVPAIGRYAAALQGADDCLMDDEDGAESGDEDWMPGLGGGGGRSGSSRRRRTRGNRGANAYRETRSQTQEEWMKEKDLHLWEVLYYQTRMVKALRNLRDNEKLREIAQPKAQPAPPPPPPPPQPPQPQPRAFPPPKPTQLAPQVKLMTFPRSQEPLVGATAAGHAEPSPVDDDQFANQPPKILSVGSGPPRISGLGSGGGNPITARIAAAAAAADSARRASLTASSILRKPVFARRTEPDRDSPIDPKTQQQLEALRRAIGPDEEEESFDLAERKPPPAPPSQQPPPMTKQQQPQQQSLQQQQQQQQIKQQQEQQLQTIQQQQQQQRKQQAASAERRDRLLKALSGRAAQLKLSMLKRRQLACQEMRLELEQEREEAKRKPTSPPPPLPQSPPPPPPTSKKPTPLKQQQQQQQQQLLARSDDQAEKREKHKQKKKQQKKQRDPASATTPSKTAAASNSISNLDDVFNSVISSGGDEEIVKQKRSKQKQQEQQQHHQASPLSKSSSSRKRQRSSSSGDVATASSLSTVSKRPQLAADEPLYCVCRQPYDPTKFYIGCDNCDNWYHGACVGLNEDQAAQLDGYLCRACRDGNKEGQDLYCVCRTPYDATRVYLACDVCDDWFHIECVGLSEAKAKAMASYTCANCKASRNAKSNHQVVINSSVHGQLLELLQRVCSRPSARIFLKPVDSRKYRDYLTIVSEPMDLGTVRQKLVKKRYKSLGAFIADVELIFANSRLYNPIISDEFRDTKDLEAFFTAEIKSLKNQVG